jgi:hypothetical protein
MSRRRADVAGLVGGAAGPVRLYGKAGVSFYRGTVTITQTIDDVTLTEDGVSEVVPGGTETSEVTSEGWGWTFGGGEVWMNRYVGAYGELTFAWLNDDPAENSDAALDDRLMSIFFGLRVHIGR